MSEYYCRICRIKTNYMPYQGCPKCGGELVESDIQYQPITLDNFAKVLEFNGGIQDGNWADLNRYELKNIVIQWNKDRFELYGQPGSKLYCYIQRQDFEFFLQYLELKIGKLKQLTKE